MLVKIRENLQGWIAGSIIALLCLSFAFWGVSSYLESGSRGGQTVAKVDGVKITQQQLDNAYEHLREQLLVQFGRNFPVTPNVQARLKQQALEQLMTSVVLSKSAEKAGFTVSPEQVNATLMTVPAFQVKGQFSRARFIQILNNLSYSEKDFLTNFANSLINAQVQNGLEASAFALPDETEAILTLAEQKRDFSYLIIPPKLFAQRINISENAINTYYQQHQDQFKTPEKVGLQYIELSASALKTKLRPTQAELQQFYQNNADSFRTPTQWHVALIKINLAATTPAALQAAEDKANMIAAKLKSGISFSKLALQYSDDQSSKAVGGTLPWFVAAQKSAQFNAALTSLQPGQVSEPFKANNAINIIKLLARKPGTHLPFAKVQEKVRNLWASNQVEQQFSQMSDRLSNLTYTNPNSLNVAAEKLGLTIKTVPVFTREGTKTGIAANAKVVAAAFSTEVLAQGDNSDPITLNPGTVVVIRVNKHEVARVKPLEHVRQQIIATLKADAATKEAKQKAAAIAASLLKNPQAKQSLAQQNQLTWIDANHVNRHADINATLLAKAFALPDPNKTPAIGIAHLTDGSYAVIEVTKIHQQKPNPEDIAKHKVFQQHLQAGFGQLAYELYVAGLMDQADIKKESV